MEKIEEIKEKANYCLNCKTKPCTKGCPLNNDIPSFIKCIKEEKYKEAYDVLTTTTVLSSICGRICPHQKQCEGKCVRAIKGKSVSIGELEAFIGDMAIKESWKISDEIKPKKEKHCKKIAIVGSGPAGLTCSAYLAKNGYDVTIYEKHEQLGGILRYGIPKFRLDRKILDLQIKKILDLGIKVICNMELGKHYTLKELKQKYDAVVLAFGANISRKMNIEGENIKGVFGANELLEYNFHPKYQGKRVAVIGGGNVAMDVSRTVKHLGADKVYVVYRRAKEHMPAEEKEIVEAKKEGVEFLFQNNIVKIKGVNSAEKIQHLTSIECIKTELMQNNDSDRPIPVDIEGTNYTLDVDFVIMAIGSETDRNIVSSLGVELNKWGCVVVDENFMTSMPNVFAGGDLIGSMSTVAWAAQNGREIAKKISNMI